MPDSVTLAELLNRVSLVLKSEVSGQQWITAEILELRENRSGHCYLELVEKGPDEGAILARARATVWASRYQMLRPYFEASTGTSLKSGIKILCRGAVEFHAVYGFSINITDIDPAYTLGDLARKKQEVILRLSREGVMEMNRGLPFPVVPQRIAIISSETAAGYGDFMDSLQNNPHGYRFRTGLFEAVMQGEGASRSIMDALDRIHSQGGAFDCVALVRGGGSKADLECFNDYELSYYITQFPLPVLSGIGHERDESVVDMVAAFGLKTPTAVADFLVDRMLAFDMGLTEIRDRLHAMVTRTVQGRKMQLERLAGNLQHFTRGYLRHERENLVQAERSLRKDSTGVIRSGRDHLARIRQILQKDLSALLARQKELLTLMETRNSLVDPANILKRGYSMTLLNGSILTSAGDAMKGDVLETRLYRGSVVSIIDKTNQKNGERQNELPGGTDRD